MMVQYGGEAQEMRRREGDVRLKLMYGESA